MSGDGMTTGNSPGTGKRVSSGGVNIIFSDSNTHYRARKPRSGEVDAMRIQAASMPIR
jgi:hypothetical protein